MRGFVSGRPLLASIALAFASLNAVNAQESADNCQRAGWDMNREMAIFHGTALKAPAGTADLNSPVLTLGQLYALDLRPQGNVQFLHAPERAGHAPSPAAGLTRFVAITSGRYRVTVDSPLWIDVVAPSGVMTPIAFNGWHQCSIFRKSVEYTLPAGQSFVLQLSDAAAFNVRIAVVPIT